MFENLKQFIVEEFKVNPDDVTPEAELVGDLGINSRACRSCLSLRRKI